MKTSLRLVLLVCFLQPLASLAQTYCQPTFNFPQQGIYISSFALNAGGIGSSSGDNGYANFVNGGPGTITSVAPGSTYSPIVQAGSFDPIGDMEYYSVWVDLDQNGSFSLNEKLAVGTAVDPFESIVLSLTIPSDAKTGYTLLRVLCTFNVDPTDACGTYDVGEAEDYTVVIDDGAPCIPLYSLGTSSGNYIDGFVMGDINNTGSGFVPSYSDFTTSGTGYITAVVPGSINTATIGSGGGGENDTYAIWVDLDRDLSFEPNELLASQLTSGFGVQSTLVNFTIPANAEPGYTRMRVMCANEQTLTDACGTYLYGETEDYTIVIDDGSPCIPVFGYQGSDGDYVSAVQLADLNWSLAPGEEPQGYLPPVYGAHLSAGYSGTLTVTSGSYENDLLTAWLDLDGDGFSGDLIGEQEVNGPFATVTFPVNIPDDFVGYAVLRVICSSAYMNNDGCAGLGSYGTTTDFTIAVDRAGWPCLPLQGEGMSTGYGIVSVDLQGQAYTPTSGFPYYNFMNGYAHRFEAGASGEFGLSTGTAGLSAVIIALDMNDDGDFSDTDEVLGIFSVLGPLFATLDIPASCPPGQHMLRLRSTDPFASQDLCADAPFGNMIDIVVVVEDPNGPCVPFSEQWTTIGDFIDGVQLGTIENMSTGASYGAAYHDYATQSADLMVGQVAPLFITCGANGGNSYSAWIDYNNDNDFDDTDELLGWIGIADPYATELLIFNVPPGTSLGPKRMRVRCVPTGISDACVSTPTGETEDYTVNINVNTGVMAATTADLRLLPTPDGVQLVSDAALIGNTYTLFDATGRTLSTGRIAGDRTDLQMTAFAKGAYTVVLSNGDARAAKRFVW